MPVGYVVTVALVALGTLFALVPLRSVGNLSFRMGLLLNEVPIVGFYWLLIWTCQAFVQGDIDAAGGWAAVGLAALTTAGLAVVAWRGLQARPALEQAMAEALGAERVHCVSMPSRYSSDHSVTDAEELAANLGMRTPLARPVMKALGGGEKQTQFASFVPLFRSSPVGPELVRPAYHRNHSGHDHRHFR